MLVRGSGPILGSASVKGSIARPAYHSHQCNFLTLQRYNSTGPGSQSASAPALSWDRFFQLRKQRRIFGTAASIPTAFAGLATGFSILATRELDLSQSVMGIDALTAHGIATVACGAFGWLIGPSVGYAVWKLIHRKRSREIALKEKDFFQHIKRNRVDPSRQSFSNPVPDFYGEKIDSVKGYRRWLKDQRAYRKKANWVG